MKHQSITRESLKSGLKTVAIILMQLIPLCNLLLNYDLWYSQFHFKNSPSYMHVYHFTMDHLAFGGIPTPRTYCWFIIKGSSISHGLCGARYARDQTSMVSHTKQPCGNTNINQPINQLWCNCEYHRLDRYFLPGCSCCCDIRFGNKDNMKGAWKVSKCDHD